MTTLANKAILSSADNHLPMLEKDMYDTWKSIMELYMMNRQHGRMILESVENGPLIWPTIEENGVTRPRKYSELTSADAIQADCEERECKLYDEFDKFAYKKGETLRDFYLRFSLLLNDINIYNVKLEQFQVNTKFLNTLPPEWSKFVTDVKLVRDLHTTNIYQLHAYLGQDEFHANEVRLMHERNSDPLTLEKVLVITTLKNELRKLKGKDLADNVVTKHTIPPEMLKIDEEPIAPRLIIKPSTSATAYQKVFKQYKERQDSPTPSSTQKNKVEAHSRTVKSSLKNKNCVVEPNGTLNVQHSKHNANSELLCVK
ncbi:hypothetical protein Tco_0360725 [Tanacetum coccineum]